MPIARIPGLASIKQEDAIECDGYVWPAKRREFSRWFSRMELSFFERIFRKRIMKYCQAAWDERGKLDAGVYDPPFNYTEIFDCDK